jgi:N-acetylglucosamine-6-phosphate deacetylase
MDEAVRNLMSFAEVDKGAALYAASRSPARAIGLGHELGCVHPGYRASLTFMTQDLKPAGVVVDGDAFV